MCLYSNTPSKIISEDRFSFFANFPMCTIPFVASSSFPQILDPCLITLLESSSTVALQIGRRILVFLVTHLLPPLANTQCQYQLQ